MGMKERLLRSLQRSASDKAALDRQILKWRKCFQEVEEQLKRPKEK